MDIAAAKLIAAAIALCPIIGVGIGLGLIFASYNLAVGRNPNAQSILDKKFFLTFALTEALAIFALVISLVILFG
ncbi:MAG: F0F1 ATP synthase subunit C [Alphaproteobacteria bacterium]|nr:F0F1 ATP synthase subunit C [Alphaproteobacteria bacterium]